MAVEYEPIKTVKLTEFILPLQPRSLAYYAFKSFLPHLQYKPRLQPKLHEAAAKELWNELPTTIKNQKDTWMRELSDEENIENIFKYDHILHNYDWCKQHVSPEMFYVFETYGKLYNSKGLYPYWLKNLTGYTYLYHERYHVATNTIDRRVCNQCYNIDCWDDDKDYSYHYRFECETNPLLEDVCDALFNENLWCQLCEYTALFRLYNLSCEEIEYLSDDDYR
uniref:Uncharacterized protein n=1 Tax=Erinnyis ello granulovirus TaxID=307444 RepID=A0A288WIE1_9BBAC|nr:hypothetical protein EREL_100 [Erinnyis ello granulovirus]